MACHSIISKIAFCILSAGLSGAVPSASAFAADPSAGPAVVVPAAAKVTTSTVLTGPAAETSVYSEPYVLTATVTAASGTPTGVVDFTAGGTLLKRVALAGETATFDLRTLVPAAYTITATYRGTADFAASTSASRTHTVASATMKVILDGPRFVRPRKTVTLTGTFTPVPPATAIPNGSATLNPLSSTPITSPVVKGKATFRVRPDWRNTTFNTYYRNAIPDQLLFAWGTSSSDFRVDVGYRLRSQVLVGDVAGDQVNPFGASLKDGAALVYASGTTASGMAIMVQRFDADGDLEGPVEVVASPVVGQGDPTVAGLEDGGFVVAWSAPEGTGAKRVVARIYDADGSSRGAAFPLKETAAGTQVRPRIVATTLGGFWAVWVDSAIDGSKLGIAARRFAADGGAQSATFRVNSTTAGDQAMPAVTRVDNGSVVVAWIDKIAGPKVQRFSSSGTAIGSEIAVEVCNIPEFPRDMEIFSTAGNGFAIAHAGPIAVTGCSPFPRTVDALFVFRSDGTLLSPGNPDTIKYPYPTGQELAVARLAGGRIAISTKSRDTFGYGVVLQFRDRTLGRLSDTDSVPVSRSADRQEGDPALAALPGGKTFIAAFETDSVSDGTDIAYTVMIGPQ